MATTRRPVHNERFDSRSAVSTDLCQEGVGAIASELRRSLADVFALYVKPKNFHWHMRGPHFRDYHLLLDEQARKIGASSLRSIGDIARHQRLKHNDEKSVAPCDMLVELSADNQQLARSLRSLHAVCDEHDDLATASLIENWIDETERRAWVLSEMTASR